MTKLFLFWSSHRAELAALLAQHVTLVAVSTLAAVAIGIPLGIFAARRPRLSAPIIGLANVVQTIPSLAMFGFLLPIPFVGGVGARAAVVVLIEDGRVAANLPAEQFLSSTIPAVQAYVRALHRGVETRS